MKTSPRIPSGPSRFAPARHGPLASLQTLINTAGLVSVDLTDTVFASMPRRDDQADWPEAGALPLPRRNDHARMMSLRLP